VVGGVFFNKNLKQKIGQIFQKIVKFSYKKKKKKLTNFQIFKVEKKKIFVF